MSNSSQVPYLSKFLTHVANSHIEASQGFSVRVFKYLLPAGRTIIKVLREDTGESMGRRMFYAREYEESSQMEVDYKYTLEIMEEYCKTLTPK